MIELDNSFEEITRIAVVGVGGAGCNAIQNLITFGIEGVDLIAINTDAKQLRVNSAPIKLIIGKSKTRGQGAGSNPEVGRQAAEEDYQSIVDLLKDNEMVFVTAGMGGGTGTGAAPLVAKAAKENNALVVGIVITPLYNEGCQRWENAYRGIENLRKYLDGLMIISNEKLSRIIREQSLPIKRAFQFADRVVYDATKGIVDLINSVGIINVDFSDVKTVIQGKGDLLIGKGVGEGDHASITAVESALNSPLLEGIDLRNSQSALVNITFGETYQDYDIVLNKIREATNQNLHLNYGLVEDDSMGSSVAVTVVITGFTNSFIQEYQEKKKSKEKLEKSAAEQGEFVANDYVLNTKNIFETAVNMKISKKMPDDLKNDLQTPALVRNQFLNSPKIELENTNESRQPFILKQDDLEKESKDNLNIDSQNLDIRRIPYFRKMMD